MNEHDLLQTIATGLLGGEYSLLLGAGASAGSPGGNGKPLPTAPGLTDALIADFKIDTGGESISLSRAYDSVARRNEQSLHNYLQDWFSNCRPTWQGLIADFKWHRIWTLNIDDVVENAFNGRRKEIASFGWRDLFYDRSRSPGDQIIHLHGMASRLNQESTVEPSLIFSISEYTRTVSDSRSWHQVFFDEFGALPFVIIGARLIEEFDLAEALSVGSSSETTSSYPSVVVLPHVTTLQEDELSSRGLRVIEREGEDFLRALLPVFSDAQKARNQVYGTSITGESARFLQQFVDLRTYQPRTVADHTDFYAGYEPTWQDIVQNSDAQFDATEMASQVIVDTVRQEEAEQSIYVLEGRQGTGKSTVLLRIANNLISQGARPFLFRNDEYLDTDAALAWLKHMPESVLLFDDIPDFATNVNELASSCRNLGIRLLVIGGVRSSRLRRVNDLISPDILQPEHILHFGRLTDFDIDELIDKLHSRGRLGRITRLNRQKQRDYFIHTANRSLFDGMAGIEGGQGFNMRLRTGYNAIADDRVKKLYAAACLAYDSDVPLPIGIGARITGLKVGEIATLVGEQFSDFLSLTDRGLRPPHRITASMVVRNVLSEQERFTTSVGLAKALGPHIDAHALTAMTRPYRLLRRLMLQDVVVRLVGPGYARDWYAQLIEDYEWNGRYWEQRALLESRLGSHTTARSYAERSLSIHPHPFAYNTLGTILFRIAFETGDVADLEAGIQSLEEALSFRDWVKTEHPFVTYFTSMLRFAQTWGFQTIPTSLRDGFMHWHRRASHASIFGHPRYQEELRSWLNQWLSFATQVSE